MSGSNIVETISIQSCLFHIPYLEFLVRTTVLVKNRNAAFWLLSGDKVPEAFNGITLTWLPITFIVQLN